MDFANSDVPATEISPAATSPQPEAQKGSARERVIDDEVSLNVLPVLPGTMKAFSPLPEGDVLFRSPRKQDGALAGPDGTGAGAADALPQPSPISNYRGMASRQRKSEESVERPCLEHKLLRVEEGASGQPSLVASACASPPASPSRVASVVRCLSQDIEQRVASINVSPSRKPLKDAVVAPSSAPPSPSAVMRSRPISPIRMPAEPAPLGPLDPSPATANPASPLSQPRAASHAPVSPANRPVTREDVYETVRRELEEKMSRQVEFLQYEINSLQEKYENSLQTNAEMRATVTEYERTLAQFIDARRARPDQHSSVDQLLQEKKKLELEIQTLQISFQNLHQRYEDIKGLHEQSRISEATLKQTISGLQQELAAAIRNSDATRKSYEDRLEKCNVEMVNIKANLENELSATKAKLLKSESRITSLESAVEAKNQENNELMTICDELIKKMDNRK